MATPSGQSSEYYSSHGPTFLRFVAFLQSPTRCSVGSVKYSLHHTFMVVPRILRGAQDHLSQGHHHHHHHHHHGAVGRMAVLRGKAGVWLLCWWIIYQVFPFQTISVRTGCYVKHLARSLVGANPRSPVQRDIKIRSVSTLTNPSPQAGQ